MNSLWFFLIIAILPFIGGLMGYFSSGKRTVFAITSTLISFLLTVYGIASFSGKLSFSSEWLNDFEIAILIDKTSLLLIALVTFISILVQVFSLEYMGEDPGKDRFYAKLGLFVFSMIGLLLADNLLLLFVFWELVGLSSYLLIGFWYEKKGVSQSARMAFMVNRVADAALLAGILLLYAETNDLSIASLSGNISFLPSLLIAIGAFGKSAQFPFSGWLTKAMVGPTPVSALIHAATMVAAGVYLLFRTAPYLHPHAMTVIAFVGIVTAFYGAVCAIIQFDVKKILAYSTISQLGYMAMGVGVGAMEASLFHLFTHAFFKAGLFLGAASIMHFLHKIHAKDAQDLRYMGGLKTRLPWTYRSFLICGSALAGLPFFSGFMSKDGILLGSWIFANDHGGWAYLIPDLGLITAMLTAFYVGRMIILIFWGEAKFMNGTATPEKNVVIIPLALLAMFSIWIFHDWNPMSHQGWMFSLLAITKGHVSVGSLIPYLSILLAMAGIILAYSLFKPGTNYNSRITETHEPVSKSRNVVFHGFYLTHLYENVGKFFKSISQVSIQIDQKGIDPLLHFSAVSSVVFSKVLALIDRFIVDGPVNLVAYLSAYMGRRFAGLSSRDGQTQLGWLLLIVTLVLIYIQLF
ncbi:MAG: NADH-quinone oxidoreductase subunit L [Bacteroidota bacterium]